MKKKRIGWDVHQKVSCKVIGKKVREEANEKVNNKLWWKIWKCVYGKLWRSGLGMFGGMFGINWRKTF